MSSIILNNYCGKLLLFIRVLRLLSQNLSNEYLFKIFVCLILSDLNRVFLNFSKKSIFALEETDLWDCGAQLARSHPEFPDLLGVCLTFIQNSTGQIFLGYMKLEVTRKILNSYFSTECNPGTSFKFK